MMFDVMYNVLCYIIVTFIMLQYVSIVLYSRVYDIILCCAGSLARRRSAEGGGQLQGPRRETPPPEMSFNKFNGF